MAFRKGRGCAIFLVGFAGLALIGGFGLKWKGRSDLAAELERIRAAGDPLLPEDFDVVDPGEGHNRREWLGRILESIEDLYDTDEDIYPAALDLPESIFWHSREDALSDWGEAGQTEYNKQLQAAYRGGRTGENLIAEYYSALADPRSLEKCSPFLNYHFRTARADLEEVLPQALQIVQCADFDQEAMIAEAMKVGADGLPGLRPAYPIGASLRLTEILRATTRQACLEGDEESLNQLLLAAFDNANAYSEGTTLLAGMTWVELEWKALDMLEDALYFFPMTDHLAELEQLVVNLRPLQVFRQALVGERAWGRMIYKWWGDQIRDEVSILDPQGFAARTYQEFDELAFLERLAGAILEFDRCKTTWELHAALGHEDAMEDPPGWSLICQFLLPRIGSTLSSNLKIETRRTLALIALTCQRDGKEAALAMAKTTLDPFDGKPLRWHEDADGTILFWSVGPDLVDDAGAHAPQGGDLREPDDITWRVKPR